MGRLWLGEPFDLDHIGVAASDRRDAGDQAFHRIQVFGLVARCAAFGVPRGWRCSHAPVRRRCAPLTAARAACTWQRSVRRPPGRADLRPASGSPVPSFELDHVENLGARCQQPAQRIGQRERHALARALVELLAIASRTRRRWPSVHSHICMAVANAQAPVPGRSLL